MDSIYPDERVVADRTIDSHIKKLRRKIASGNANLEFIHSVYGMGYKLELLEDAGDLPPKNCTIEKSRDFGLKPQKGGKT
jgi:hypothetical protein